jgi:hypothetical protein
MMPAGAWLVGFAVALLAAALATLASDRLQLWPARPSAAAEFGRGLALARAGPPRRPPRRGTHTLLAALQLL